MLSETALSRNFVRLGARFRLNPRRAPRGWALDIVRDEEGSEFELRAEEKTLSELDAVVANVDRASRHLLLFVRAREGARLHRYLCGHDERDWFLATIPGKASTVAQAMEALKPKPVIEAQASAGLRRKQFHRRHNAAFLRQGEWFFLPAPDLDTRGQPIHRWEPIRRGNGKPHLVEELARVGGTLVHFDGRRTVPAAVYEELCRRYGRKQLWGWSSGIRGARVYARGLVRHPDHSTLKLNRWHEVLANTEARASIEAQRRLAFID